MAKKKAKNSESSFSVRFIFKTKEEREDFLEDIRPLVAGEYDFSAITEDLESEELDDGIGSAFSSSCSSECIDSFFEEYDGDDEEEDWEDEEEEYPDDPKEATVLALDKHEGDIEAAAFDLGLDKSTIYKRIKRFGLNLEDYR